MEPKIDSAARAASTRLCMMVFLLELLLFPALRFELGVRGADEREVFGDRVEDRPAVPPARWDRHADERMAGGIETALPDNARAAFTDAVVRTQGCVMIVNRAAGGEPELKLKKGQRSMGRLIEGSGHFSGRVEGRCRDPPMRVALPAGRI